MKKTVVRSPGPSWTHKRWTSKTIAVGAAGEGWRRWGRGARGGSPRLASRRSPSSALPQGRATVTAVSRFVVVPSPSWPAEFCPQHQAPPARASAQL